jgi:hypothetical protein
MYPPPRAPFFAIPGENVQFKKSVKYSSRLGINYKATHAVGSARAVPHQLFLVLSVRCGALKTFARRFLARCWHEGSRVD